MSGNEPDLASISKENAASQWQGEQILTPNSNVRI